MRYFIINTFSETITEEKDDSWFSNPIKKLGSARQLMCELSTYGGYEAKNSWASKKYYSIAFYTYGKNVDFYINGWRFPKEIRRGVDSMSGSARSYNTFNMKVVSPDGKEYYVSSKVDEPYIWGVMKVIYRLSTISQSTLDEYSYEIQGKWHLKFDSYVSWNSCERVIML